MLRTRTSWTEISTWRTCPHKHHLQYGARWRTEHTTRPLEVGTLGHSILELHYAGIVNHGEPDIPAIIDLLKGNGAEDEEHPRHEYAKTCLWAYHGYRKRWQLRDPAEWRFKRVEEEFKVPLPNGVELVMRIDLLAERIVMGRARGLWVWDHKFMKTLPNDRELDLDDQTGLYIWGCRQMGIPVTGALLNVCKTERLKRAMSLEERFERFWIHRSDAHIDKIIQEAMETVELMDHALGLGIHPRTTNPQTCKWMCPFLVGCLAGRQSNQAEGEVLRAKGFVELGPSRLKLEGLT